MSISYRYRLRPAYNSDELLLEFFLDSADFAFVAHLMESLAGIIPAIESEVDYLNGEKIININSSAGRLLFEQDSWGFGFLTASENQSVILMVDAILGSNPLFTKEDVDFNKYRK